MEEPQNSAPRRVEAYLDAVLTALPRRLSAFQISELRRELRTHLWERVAAYEELGQTEDDAVTEALSQFGGGKDFVKQWRQDWKKTPHRVTLREIWEATRLALPVSLSAQVLVCGGWAVAIYFAYSSSLGGPFLDAVAAGFGLGGTIIAPLVLGAVHSRRTPRRAGMGMAGALSLEIMGLGTLTWLAGRLLPGGDQNRIVQNSEAFLLIMFLWLPLASGAAALTGWRARRGRARRVA